MKKILIIVLFLLVLEGCGEKTKLTTCNGNSKINGINTEIKIDLQNDGNYIKKEIQESTITAETNENFEMISEKIENLNLKEKVKNMEGVSYELLTNINDKRLEENIIVDFAKISGEDYFIMTNGQVKATGEKIKLLLDETVQGFEKAGLVCNIKK
ncbi:MAG: hypothetical protein RR500_00840 [Bacilli bacterium]